MSLDPWWRTGVKRLALAERTRELVEASPTARESVERFIAGEHPEDAITAALERVDKGLEVTFAHVGPVGVDDAAAESVAGNYRTVLARAAEAGLVGVDLTLDLDQLGLGQGSAGLDRARQLARELADEAARRGATITLDMPSPRTGDLTDDVLQIARDMRADHPRTGVTLLASRRRTASDLPALATDGSRVRLSKGAEPETGGWDSVRQADRAYVRALRSLMESPAHVMVSTHDARLVSITHELVRRTGRTRDDYEFQMPMGVRSLEHRRLVDTGRRLRVYIPFGAQWHEYLVARVLERPRLMRHLARQLISRR